MDHLPNRTKIYYKITNQKENHNGLQYKTGLIIDHRTFNSNPKQSCVVGGIYFTTKEYLHMFFGYGQWIRPVTIPKNAKVMLDPEGNKYRADRLLFYPRKTFKFYFTNLFDPKTFPKDYYFFLIRNYPSYLNKWFNKDFFPRKDYKHLAKYCPEHFNKWFDKDLFPKEDYSFLEQYCSDSLKHIH